MPVMSDDGLYRAAHPESGGFERFVVYERVGKFAVLGC